MSWDNECIDCGKPISDEYERCYECNTAHNETDLRFKVSSTSAETDKAVLVVLERKREGKVELTDETWLPKSEVEFDDDRAHVYVPAWLAEKKEIDGFAI